jgi:hypothetical protein
MSFQDLERCRLARSVGAEQRKHLSLIDSEADAADGIDRAVALEQILDLDSRHRHDPFSLATSGHREDPAPPVRNLRERSRDSDRVSVNRCWWRLVAAVHSIVDGSVGPDLATGMAKRSPATCETLLGKSLHHLLASARLTRGTVA